MGYLKIIFYGLLAFIERHPIFTLIIVALAVFAPFVFKAIGWILLAILAILLVLIGVAVFRFRKMRRDMEKQFRNGPGAGFGGQSAGFGGPGAGFGGFQGFGNMQGMTLEELVRQMQEQANARKAGGSGAGNNAPKGSTTKRVSDSVGDYVDFEEVDK